MGAISVDIVLNGQRLTEDDLRRDAALPALGLPDDELALLLGCLRCLVHGCAPTPVEGGWLPCCEALREAVAVATGTASSEGELSTGATHAGA